MLLSRKLSMNFPASQRTGLLAEQRVEHQFTTWGWIVGHDRIDVGYDLTVEPDRDRFSGHRFLVQVKGTLRNGKRGLTAQVSKMRLRQYAANPLPVFLVRSTPDGQLYWLHVQQWVKRNPKHLQGDGESSVRFDPSSLLSDEATFVSHLIDVFRPLSTRRSAVVDLIKEREAHLSSIDERISVQLQANHRGETTTLYARQPGPIGNLSFLPTQDPHNIGRLREIMEFGRPDTIEVDDFHLTGSKLFKTLGLDAAHRGRLTIQSALQVPISVCFYPSLHPSPLSLSLRFRATMFAGQKGFSISNESHVSLLTLTMRMWEDTDHYRMEIGIKLRDSALSAAPIQALYELDPFLDWAESAIDADGMMIEVGSKERARMPAPSDQARNALAFFQHLAVLSKIHRIAKALNSPLVLDDEFELSEREAYEIDLAYALLKGERREANGFSADVDGIDDQLIPEDFVFQVCTSLELTVGGRVLGTVPIVVDLERFTIDRSSGKQMLMGSPGRRHGFLTAITGIQI
jgi:DNA polymerase III psi subunit